MKKISALLLMLCYGSFSFACTTFLLSKNGRHLFGRNYDWITESGMVMVNARGLDKTSARTKDGKQANWRSKYGSITFNQYGKENPTGGMNEKGLVVELMWLDETQYPAKDERYALGVLQWIQYQLDCSGSVAEVLSSNADIRISDEVPLHYLVADAEGNAATIEFLKGQMVVHQKQDLPYPVLTNTIYKDALNQVGSQLEGSSPASFSDNSVARFATACQMVGNIQAATQQKVTVDQAFSILDAVRQRDFTKWSIVYDISARQVHFVTQKHRNRKSFAFADFDFSCEKPTLAFDMNQEHKGRIAAHFVPLRPEQNKQLIERSAKESEPQVRISRASIEENAALFRINTCSQ